MLAVALLNSLPEAAAPIFDEIDAVCKRRDDANTVNKSRVHDNVVNQLLTKIDGLATQNNLLVIGVTNRRDLLDEALLRPGRLEVHIEIPLPDAVGREQILNIHTRQLEDENMLGSSVNLQDVASRTRGFTGAELEGLARSAIAFALSEHQETLAAATNQSLDNGDADNDDDMSRMVKFLEEQSATTVEMRHFEEALVSVERSSDLLNEAHRRDVLEGNVVDRSESEAWRAAAGALETLASATVASDDMLTRSVLLWGARGSGRMTTIANEIECHDFESIQRLTPHDFIKRTDHHRLLTDAYEDSKRSKRSILIVEDVDQIIPLCPNVVPMLNVMMESAPKSKTSMCVIITSSSSRVENLVVGEIVHHPTPTLEECEQYVELRSGLSCVKFEGETTFEVAHQRMERAMFTN